MLSIARKVSTPVVTRLATRSSPVVRPMVAATRRHYNAYNNEAAAAEKVNRNQLVNWMSLIHIGCF